MLSSAVEAKYSAVKSSENKLLSFDKRGRKMAYLKKKNAFWKTEGILMEQLSENTMSKGYF